MNTHTAPKNSPEITGAFNRLRAAATAAWNHKEVIDAVDRAEREVAIAVGALPPEGYRIEPEQRDLWG